MQLILGLAQESNGAATCSRGAQVMDIRIARTGKIFREVDHTLASILHEAWPDEIQRVVNRSEVAAQANTVHTPQFSVARNEYAGFWWIVCQIGHRTEFFDGQPKKAQESFLRQGLHCPDAIVAQYEAALKTAQSFSSLQKSGL
jgi:hypothetical protein